MYTPHHTPHHTTHSSVIYLNSNLKENSYRLLKEEQKSKMKNTIFKSNFYYFLTLPPIPQSVEDKNVFI